MHAIRFRWRLLAILAIAALGYLVFRDDAPDLTEDLRQALRTAPGSLYRVIYVEDIARDHVRSNWSLACVVEPYADAAGDTVHEPLSGESWVGGSREDEWRIAVLDERRVLRSFRVRYRLFQLVELHRSGRKCVRREDNPVLRVSKQLSGALLVQLGAGDARPSQ